MPPLRQQTINPLQRGNLATIYGCGLRVSEVVILQPRHIEHLASVVSPLDAIWGIAP